MDAEVMAHADTVIRGTYPWDVGGALRAERFLLAPAESLEANNADLAVCLAA